LFRDLEELFLAFFDPSLSCLFHVEFDQLDFVFLFHDLVDVLNSIVELIAQDAFPFYWLK
jgi:hypothetical protein